MGGGGGLGEFEPRFFGAVTACNGIGPREVGSFLTQL